MKFIHMADMHFDAPFTVLTQKHDLGEKRRLEQRAIFKNIIETIKKENIEFLLISGDLYEHEYIRENTIKYINDLFKTIPNTKIFISPGNHDPFIKNSYYNKYNWNDNVYIFKSQIEVIELDDVDIYGYGFQDFYSVSSGVENIKIKNKDKINILLAHGDIDASTKMKLEYNPISTSKLKNIGFDYIALGHIHKQIIKEEDNIFYPGSTISFGFDELGEHGIFICELNNNYNNDIYCEEKIIINNDKLKLIFKKMDNLIFEEKELNISEVGTLEELIEKIDELKLNKNNLYKIIFIGYRNFEININKINKLVNSEKIIKLQDKTKMKYDIESLAKQKNLKGIFVREMLEKLKDESYSSDEVYKAIEIGLNSFS